MRSIKLSPLAFVVSQCFALTATAWSIPVLSGESEQVQAPTTEFVVLIGSRSQKQRSLSDSPAPVDLISAQELESVNGTADLIDHLKALIPSYTATPATGDGSAFVRPTSLRGTASDQTLILVDGKRRHRSALVQLFAPAVGNGSHAADISMIPAIALQRVEVLRDGAASQYGSDAIAGVINFVTKDANHGTTVELSYDEFYLGEQSFNLALNKGLAFGDDGFVNLSVDLTDNEALSRGKVRPDALALIASGVVGVGNDSPFADAPLTQSWGRPETSAFRLFVNAGLALENNKALYARAGFAKTAGRYRFFYRNPNHESITAIEALGYIGSVSDIGYTPFLDGEQRDSSVVFGLEGEFYNGTNYDFSASYGKNKLDYNLFNTINPSLALSPDFALTQKNFNVGSYHQRDLSLNVDFSVPLADSLNFAYGAEWRQDTFSIVAGEQASYYGLGASGFKGVSPDESGDFSRHNVAAYVDIEHDIDDDLLMQYALRHENFSDFGGTTNWKLAANYSLFDDLSLRGAISTGFHAPTPGQSNIRNAITTFDSLTGNQLEERLIPATDPLAMANGGQAMEEEKSKNYSVGLTAAMSDTTSLTLDFYKIEVDDRIYRTGNLEQPDGGSISFFTNALDVEHSGVDVVVLSQFEAIATDISFAYSYSKIDVVEQRLVNGLQPVIPSTVEDIENNLPRSRFVVTTNTQLTDLMHLTLRANYYGQHYDERGTIGALVEPSAPIDATIYIDAQLSYRLSDSLMMELGVTNLFDTYVDEIDAPYANRQDIGLQYPRRTAANYEGGSWHLGFVYSF